MGNCVADAGVDKRPVERRELVVAKTPGVQRPLGPVEARLKLRSRPAGAPLVVVGVGGAQDDAGIVRGAAAEDACAELRPIVLVGALPAVGIEGEPPAVEDVGGPPAVVVRAVVWSRLDQADASRRILAEPPGEHAAGGAAAG